MSKWMVSRSVVGALCLAPAITLSIGCGDMPSSDEVVGKQGAIFNGALPTSATGTGVVLVRANGTGSGTIVNQYWVLTCAHAFAAAQDANNDGVITFAEGAGQTVVSGGPDLNGNPVALTAYAIYKHPASVWQGTAPSGIDAALIFLSPSSYGYSVKYLNQYSYSGGTVNVYQGATAPLVGADLMAWGYGPTGPNWVGAGALNWGWKVLHTAYANSYMAVQVPSTGRYGTMCHGDSGGPDFYLEANPFRYSLVGIHSILNDEDCTGQNGLAADWDSAASSWREWMTATSRLCPAVTRSGRCHF